MTSRTATSATFRPSSASLVVSGLASAGSAVGDRLAGLVVVDLEGGGAPRPPGTARRRRRGRGDSPGRASGGTSAAARLAARFAGLRRALGAAPSAAASPSTDASPFTSAVSFADAASLPLDSVGVGRGGGGIRRLDCARLDFVGSSSWGPPAAACRRRSGSRQPWWPSPPATRPRPGGQALVRRVECGRGRAGEPPGSLDLRTGSR